MKKILAFCLALVMVLSLAGCYSGKSLSGDGGDYVSYKTMVYQRPDMEEFAATLSASCDIARSSADLDEVVEAIYDYYDAYDWFYTNYDLAYIEYNRDTTSEKWQEEYDFCSQYASEVEAGLEELYMVLAHSPVREELEGDDYFGEGYFDYYEGEAVWDDTFLAMMEKESALVSEYYDLCTLADAEEYYSDAYFDGYADALCQNLIDLVKLRQEIADYMGYDSYVQFAYDFYYYRDYTPAQAMDYMMDIQNEMYDLYQKVNASYAWEGGYGYCTEEEMYSYLSGTVSAMGGTIEEAFGLMEQAELYDIAYNDKKFNTSFEIYLTWYYEPYIFVNPSGYDLDKLSFAHEFGHFVTDYASYGSYAGIDVQEVFSQGMEYLSLCYDDGEEMLEKYKMADCVSTYVEQAAYACFEQQLYDLAEELTVEQVFELYETTCRSFGIDFEAQGWDTRDLVTVPHFYTDPMYIISYVVSNDAAFQLFQMELGDKGQGLEKFEETMTTECYYFLEFIEEAGLESPFTPGRVAEVADDLKDLLR